MGGVLPETSKTKHTCPLNLGGASLPVHIPVGPRIHIGSGCGRTFHHDSGVDRQIPPPSLFYNKASGSGPNFTTPTHQPTSAEAASSCHCRWSGPPPSTSERSGNAWLQLGNGHEGGLSKKRSASAVRRATSKATLPA